MALDREDMNCSDLFTNNNLWNFHFSVVDL